MESKNNHEYPREELIKDLQKLTLEYNLLKELYEKEKDGKSINGLMSASLIDLDGVPHLIKITKDITGHSLIEEELAREQFLLNALMNNLADYVYLKDLENRFTRISKSHAFAFELDDPDQAIGKTDFDFFTKEHAQQSFEDEQTIIRTGLPMSKEEKLTWSNRSDMWVFSTKLPLRNHEGNIIGTFGISRDITESKKAEEELQNELKEKRTAELLLKESYRKINTLIGNLQGMVYRCLNDKTWTMEFLSEGTRELTGYSPEDFLNNRTISFEDIIHKDDRDSIRAEVQAAIKDKEHFQHTYRIITRSGEIRWVWEKGEGVFSQDGKLEFLEGFITDITQRKNMEEALRLSEEKFRSIAENLSDIIFITDTEGIITYISPSCKTFGYNPKECIGKFFGEFLAEGELDNAMPVFKSALTSVNATASASLTVKRKDGSNFFAELTGSVFKIGNENTGILGLLRDVTDKMNREFELRKLSSAVEQSPISIVITDTDGKIEYVNPKLCKITGYSKDELIGKNPGILSSKEKSKEEYKVLWDTIKAGNDWKGEFHNKKKNGELYWESASVSPVKNEKDEITHFLGIKEDITLQKFLEAATIASEKRYHELFLNNPVPTYIFDENTLEFIEVNDATVQNYGYSRNEFASMTLKDIRLAEDIPDLLEAIKDLGNDTFQSVNMRHRRKDGTVFPVEITSHSLPEKNYRKTRLVMSIDTTEHVKAAELMELAKEKAEASDKLKTTFLNNISHEVRTPLNGIIGFAEIMSHPGLSEEDKKESISMLFESSNRLLNTITNYMDISLLTSGNMSAYKKDFNPGPVLRKFFDNYKTLCSSRNLELFLKIPEQADNLSVNSDPEIFRKIISHLLNNAIKFTEKGSINFGYIINKEEPEFFVKDTGIGIGKESIINIFDRFVKEDRGKSRIIEGSGLGLSIAKGLVEIIGGNIRVESEVGEGTCFYFTIP